MCVASRSKVSLEVEVDISTTHTHINLPLYTNACPTTWLYSFVHTICFASRYPCESTARRLQVFFEPLMHILMCQFDGVDETTTVL